MDIALKDAYNKTGISFEKKDVYLIGDTIRDIKCAKDAGVKIIAVASGKESFELLQKENPDYIFKDFHNTEEIVSILTQ